MEEKIRSENCRRAWSRVKKKGCRNKKNREKGQGKWQDGGEECLSRRERVWNEVKMERGRKGGDCKRE